MSANGSSVNAAPSQDQIAQDATRLGFRAALEDGVYCHNKGLPPNARPNEAALETQRELSGQLQKQFFDKTGQLQSPQDRMTVMTRAWQASEEGSDFQKNTDAAISRMHKSDPSLKIPVGYVGPGSSLPSALKQEQPTQQQQTRHRGGPRPGL